MSYFEAVRYADSPNLDAFGRLRTSDPTTVFESSFLYDLQPLIYEQTTATGGTITHDATNSSALLTTTTTNASQSIMRSYRHIRYQPGKSQLIKLTFNMGATSTDNTKKIGVYNSLSANGVLFQRAGTILSMNILSSTSSGNQSVAQSSWNIDKMDGTGPSGLTIDTTKAQILFINFQWLGVGRVVVGFSINGTLWPVHQFLNANSVTVPYMATGNLPVYVENVNTGAGASATSFRFICAAVESEGGVSDQYGYSFSAEGTVTAASGARTAILSIRPRTTFNSVVNRTQLDFLDLSMLNPGTAPVYWELCIGVAFSVAPTFANVNATYSGMEYSSAPGTYTNLTTGIVVASGYLQNGAGATSAGLNKAITNLYPLTLDASGAQRALGTMTLLVTGVGGSSAGVRAAFNWKEVR